MLSEAIHGFRPESGIMQAGSGERDHSRPPLGRRPDIDVVFAREVELAVAAHAEHRKAGRQVYHLAALPPCAGGKRSSDEEPRAGVEPEGARMRGTNVGML